MKLGEEFGVMLGDEKLEKYELPTTILKYIAFDDILAAMCFTTRYLTEETHMALVQDDLNWIEGADIFVSAEFSTN